MAKKDKQIKMSDDPPPYSSTNALIGLELLKILDKIEVLQKTISTEHGEVIFNLKRELAGTGLGRNIKFHYYDTADELGITYRPVSSCIKPRLEVLVRGEPVATLRLQCLFSCCPVYIITDAYDRTVLKIKAPRIGQTEYIMPVQDLHKRNIGVIERKAHAATDQLFADSMEFGVRFPKDLPVELKAAVVGICVLIVQAALLPRT